MRYIRNHPSIQAFKFLRVVHILHNNTEIGGVLLKDLNKYTMNETLKVAKQASMDIENYLKSKPETVSVINVEDDKRFQEKDIDLLWIYNHKGKEQMKMIEIKGDRYSHTGNFFIETDSNKNKGTPGCFMYCEADYIFYYFIDTGEINIMPMIRSRRWFKSNIDRFEEKKLATKVGNGGMYTSAGRLVPKQIMRKELGLKHKIIPEAYRTGTLSA